MVNKVIDTAAAATSTKLGDVATPSQARKKVRSEDASAVCIAATDVGLATADRCCHIRRWELLMHLQTILPL